MITQEMYKGKWGAKDLSFHQFWNDDQYCEAKNYSRRRMIYHTPEYWSRTDEQGERGDDNSHKAEIQLTVNVEEGVVFLGDIPQKNKAKLIFANKEEEALFVQNAQKLYDEEYDMGKGTCFIFGWGGCMANLREYDNPNIQYLPIVFPDTEKFRIAKYREKVEWSLIEKGAIYIVPKEGEKYLAVIQRKNKPRDLFPFRKFLGALVAKETPIVKETPVAKEICFYCGAILGKSVTETDFYVTCNECYQRSKEEAINRLMASKPCAFRACYKLLKMIFGENRINSFVLARYQEQPLLPEIPATLVARQHQLQNI